MEGCSWPLAKYARCCFPESDHNWEYFSKEKESLTLHLIHFDQLMVVKGKTVYESHSVHGMREDMRGVAMGDSLLIMLKAKNMMRQFRVKFSASNDGKSPIDKCRTCAEVLSKYFPVKINSITKPQNVSSTIERQGVLENTNLEGTQDPSLLGVDSRTVRTGEVTLGDISKSLLNQSDASLPSIYTRLTPTTLTPTDLDTYIRMCLTDASFPAFVAQVDKSLRDIITEH